MGLGGGDGVLLVDDGDEDFFEGDDVFGDVAHGAFDFFVFGADFSGEWGWCVRELFGAHGLDDEFFAGHFAEAFHGEAAFFEFGAEFVFVAVVEFAHLAFDFLVDELGFDGSADEFEFIEDDFAVDEFLEDAVARFLEAAFELGAAARELCGELGVGGGEEEGDFVFGDDLAIDLGGDAVDFDGLGVGGDGEDQGCDGGEEEGGARTHVDRRVWERELAGLAGGWSFSLSTTECKRGSENGKRRGGGGIGGLGDWGIGGEREPRMNSDGHGWRRE